MSVFSKILKANVERRMMIEIHGMCYDTLMDVRQITESDPRASDHHPSYLALLATMSKYYNYPILPASSSVRDCGVM
jgi:hypothetical protein